MAGHTTQDHAVVTEEEETAQTEEQPAGKALEADADIVLDVVD